MTLDVKILPLLLEVARTHITFLLATLLACLVYKRISKIYTLEAIPGPPASNWILGHGLEVQASPVGTRYNVWSQTYGPTYRLKGPFGTSELIMGDPKGAGHVLSSPNYVRPASDRQILIQFFGEGLFSSEGEQHKLQRSVLNSAFTSASVREVSNVIFHLADNLASAWQEELDEQHSESDKIIEVTSQIHRVALDAISMTTFAYDISHSDQSIQTLIDKISNVPQSVATLVADALVDLFPILTKLPNPMKDWTTMLRTELGRIADAVWSQNEKNRDAGLYTKLLDSMNNSERIMGQPMSRDLAIAQIVGVLFAGYESTANVIAECLYELSRDVSIQTKLRKEILEFIQQMGREPNFDDLFNGAHLQYLDAVTRETLRTKAVLMTITREAIEADRIPVLYPIPVTGNSYVAVEPGQVVHIPVRDGINTDKRIWGSDAHLFRPERWLDVGGLPETVRSIHAPGNLMTFGDGSKICLGRYFAVAEFKIVVSTLVRQFVFEPDGLDYVFYKTGGNTVKPKIKGRENEGVQLHLRVHKVREDN